MHLRRADAWLQVGEESGILYRRRLGLSPEQRAVMREQIASALAQIATLADRFGLSADDEDLGAAIAAQMSADWANLCDVRSDKLCRYGEVHPDLAHLLDADISALAERVAILANAGRGRGEP